MEFNPKPPVQSSHSSKELIPKQQSSFVEKPNQLGVKYSSTERPHSSDSLPTMPKASMFMLSPEAMIEEMLNDDSPNVNQKSLINRVFPSNP